MSYQREGTVYLQVRAWSRYWETLSVAKATQRKPTVVEPGCIVVKVKLQIPAAAWQPLTPEAVVTVPEELVQRPIAVEAVDPE